MGGKTKDHKVRDIDSTAYLGKLELSCIAMVSIYFHESVEYDSYV